MSDDDVQDGSPEQPHETSNDLAANFAALQELRAQHRHLDSNITALQQTGVTDMLKIARMKKLKLQLKDKIRALEEQVTPDIIA